MPTRPPNSYDDIARRTVPEPDSSFRPTAEQLEDTRAGRLALDADERALLEAVRQRLTAYPQIAATVEGRRVTLEGAVADPATLQRIVDLVQGIGQIELDDRLHIK
jgi:hypothetical protein